jgi:hypothetical protein
MPSTAHAANQRLFSVALNNAEYLTTDTIIANTKELSAIVTQAGGSIVEVWQEAGFVKCWLNEGSKLMLDAMGSFSISEDIPNFGDPHYSRHR